MDTPPDVYFSWTGTVPQQAWQPSSAFMVFLDKDLCNQREATPNDAWRCATNAYSRAKAGKPKKPRAPRVLAKLTKPKPKAPKKYGHDQMYMDLITTVGAK